MEVCRMNLPSGLQKFAQRFEEELRFFKGWVDEPKAVGTFVPTGSVTARRMASVIDVDSGLPVLELGPGTGVITRAILARGVEPGRLYAIEYSAEFYRHLVCDHPGVNFIHGDAFDVKTCLGDKRKLKFDSAISGVPLLNCPVPQRVRYVESLLDLLPQGRPVVQLTFGPLSPVPPGLGNYNVIRFDFILRNIPPTTLWLYNRGKPIVVKKSKRARVSGGRRSHHVSFDSLA
jgi:phosphatidylethanolamine/phosphatidyl-N-methylethanolamine N-methyltransferase